MVGRALERHLTARGAGEGGLLLFEPAITQGAALRARAGFRDKAPFMGQLYPPTLLVVGIPVRCEVAEGAVDWLSAFRSELCGLEQDIPLGIGYWRPFAQEAVGIYRECQRKGLPASRDGDVGNINPLALDSGHVIIAPARLDALIGTRVRMNEGRGLAVEVTFGRFHAERSLVTLSFP